MGEEEQFRIGAVVRCTSGEVCGEVRYLDINRRAHTLTHLAVEEKDRLGLGRLVPTARVHVDRQTHEIQFAGTMADFRELEASDVTEFAADTEGYELYGAEQVVEEPEYDPIAGEQVVGGAVPGFSATETVDNVPEGDVEVPAGSAETGRKYRIHAGSHEFGRVHGVLTDAGHHVTHVLLGEWHGLRHKEVAVPFTDQDTVQDDGFHLSLSKQQIEALPPLGDGS
ncbi:MAG TPA: hypothetical protein VGS19_34620 [Streptosporangiaceae bacterium]|nr:hypothetical protein [Streptosporangiaceae bacterium]